MENLIPSLHPVYKMPSGPREDWLKTTTPIDQGIGCLATDTNELRIGNGRDLYKDLPVIKRVPMINIIVAMTDKNIIIQDDIASVDIEDLYFKFLQILRLDKVIIIGEDMYKKFPYFIYCNCIVIANTFTSVNGTNTHVVYSKEDALNRVLSLQKDALVVGGKDIYEMFLPHTDKLFVATDLAWNEYKGDVVFPQYDGTQFTLSTVYVEKRSITMFSVKCYLKK